MSTKKIQIINSLVKQAENADTLDGKHADEFAAASEVDASIENLQTQIDAISNNPTTASNVYIVPYYSSTSITDAQVAEIVETTNKIKADTGSYAVFMNANGTLIPAQYSYNSRTGARIFAVEHTSTSATQYTIQAKTNGTVTTSADNFFIEDMNEAGVSFHAPTVQAVAAYVDDVIAAIEPTGSATKTFVFTYDASKDINLAVYDEFVTHYNASGLNDVEVKVIVGNAILPASISYSTTGAMAQVLIDAINGNSGVYHIVVGRTTIDGIGSQTCTYNAFSGGGNVNISTTFDEADNTNAATQKAIADWVKAYIEEIFMNGEW
jgi:hypothetical protein